MAEVTQALNQANAGDISLQGLMEYAKRGTPQINQPQAVPKTGGGADLQGLMEYAQRQRQPAPQTMPQPSVPGPTPTGPNGEYRAEDFYTPASPEVLSKPSVWKDLLQPSLKDAADMAIKSGLPTLGTIAGGAVGSIIPGAGTVAGAAAGAAAGGALGTYLNDVFGIDESTAVDYALNAGLPLAGGAVSKAGRAVLKRMPSFQAAQKAASVKVARGLTDMVMDKPEEKLVKAAWQQLDQMGAAYPTANIHDDIVQNATESTQKFIQKRMAEASDDLADVMSNPLRVQMTPSELQKYNSVLKTSRNELLKRGKPGDAARAKQIKDVIDATTKRIDDLASAGDQGATAIKNANALTRQSKTYDDIDELLQQSIKSKVVKGQLEDSIDVAKVWNRVNTIERQLGKDMHSKDEFTMAVKSLMDHPEAYQQFKAGLQRIAKLTPDGNLRIIGESGGGVLERAARAAGQEINTGALTRLLGTSIGQDVMERTLRDQGGKMTVPMLATMFTTIRPILSGVAPENDPLVQSMTQRIQESIGVNKQAQEQTNRVNQQATPSKLPGQS